LGVGSVASYLAHGGFGVCLLDNSIMNLSPEQFKERLQKISPRFIGLSLLTFTVNNAVALARAAKEVNRDIVVIAGGPHASALPREVLRHDAIDIVVKGEGEETALDVLRALDKGRGLEGVPGIVYKDKGVLRENPDRPLIKDLDSLPLPAYDLMPMDKYYAAASRRFTSGKIGSIITSRGCPNRCTFCSRAVFGRTVRYRNPRSVIREIQHLVDRFAVRELLFWDDAFTADKGHAIEISRLMRETLPDLVWSCYSRADHFSDELYAELYKGGCRELSFGIESGSQAVLDSIRKDVRVEEAKRAIEGCRRHRLLSFCSFMLGLPQDTADTLRQTIDLALELDPDYAAFCSFVPLPGSEIFRDMTEKGLIDLKTAKWDHFVNLMSAEAPPVQAGLLTGPDLVRWQKKAMRDFYFRPAYVYKSLRKIRSVGSFVQRCRGLGALLRYQLSRIGTCV
jgi:radical SAM superfamily enzyme YgiQ (UPF0313 family)